MAAVLKKRALAEYSQTIQEEPPEPRKKLRLVHKPKSLEPLLSFQGSSSIEETLQVLLKFEGSLPIEAEHLDHCLRLLIEQYHGCKDTAVRAKIAAMCGLLSRTPSIDGTRIVNDVLNLIKTEESQKVMSQLLGALLICGQCVPFNKKLHQQILSVGLKNLNKNSHLVKCKVLDMIGSLGSPQISTSEVEKKSSLQQILGKFTHDSDSRVRMAAFEAMLCWHQRGLTLDQTVYEKASQALTDDYEGVRSVATKLIWVLSQVYPERKIAVPGSEEENRLIDDGFAKICDMLNDCCVSVRAEAAALLGSLHGVSQKFLDQTLDKMLMSNMQKKKSTQEKLRETFSVGSGGFSSGKKWADDAPKESGEEESVTLMAMGACGAFVSGLEDEYMEVRNATIDSVCELATRSKSFAMRCVDVLVDMFNDEIVAVQLNAINSLRKISQVIILREDQLEVIMGCMKAQSYDVREAFRALLGCVKFATRYCLNGCVSGLLELLKKYPQDRQDLWKCMRNIGKNHPSFVLALTPDLLSCHPYFEAIEPDMEDPAYVAVLLLVFNAAEHCPTMLTLFPDHTVRHYSYLRDTLSNLVPSLNLQKSTALEMTHSPPRCVSPNTFLHQTLDRLQTVEKLDSNGASQLIRMGIRDLERVSELEATLAPNACLMSMYLESHLCLCKVFTQYGQHVSSFVPQSQINAGPLLSKVVSLTNKMEQQFLGLAIDDRSQVIQLRILAQSVQLLGLLRNNLTGMKQSCIQYLQILNNFERFLQSNKLSPNQMTACLLCNMEKLESCDPAVYHSVLAEAVHSYKPQLLRLHNNVKKASAEVVEHAGSSDKTLSFITGLAVAVDMVININDLEDTSLVRIQVKYPDQQLHTFVPKASDFRQLSPCRHRLVTKVLMSHQQWSEACQVEICVVLCYKKDKEFTEDRTGDKNRKTEDYIQLCKPVKISLAPKALKK